jgi:type II secretory pathway pseudopilin PulG
MILTSEKTHRRLTFRTKRCEAGFVMTLWEVLIAVVIVAVVFGLIFDGYVTSAKMAQWTGFSLAAQSMAGQAVEQARSAVWDIALQKTEVTNMTLLNKQITYNGINFTMTGYTTNILDIPWKGTNYVMATNYITVQSFFQNGVSNPWVQMQSVTVQTVWPFDGWGNYTLQYYTNTVCTFIAPDNRDPQTLGD